MYWLTFYSVWLYRECLLNVYFTKTYWNVEGEKINLDWKSFTTDLTQFMIVGCIMIHRQAYIQRVWSRAGRPLFAHSLPCSPLAETPRRWGGGGGGSGRGVGASTSPKFFSSATPRTRVRGGGEGGYSRGPGAGPRENYHKPIMNDIRPCQLVNCLCVQNCLGITQGSRLAAHDIRYTLCCALHVCTELSSNRWRTLIVKTFSFHSMPWVQSLLVLVAASLHFLCFTTMMQ